MVTGGGPPPLGDVRVMSRAGVGTLRQMLSWPSVRRQGWAPFDKVVKAAALQGIRVAPTAFGTPGKLAPSQYHPPIGTEAQRHGWSDFLREAVSRYKPGGSFWSSTAWDENGPLLPPNPKPVPITSWQIWVEQNSPVFFAPAPSPAKYARLVTISSRAIRGAHAGADVDLGGMYTTPPSSSAIDADDFIERMFSANPQIGRTFDNVAVNPYAATVAGVEEKVRLMRRALRTVGAASKGMRVAEFGWATDGPARSPQVVTASQQARLLRGAYRLFAANRRDWNLTQAVWYSWRDHDEQCQWCHSTGLLRRNGERKPSWFAYRDVAG